MSGQSVRIGKCLIGVLLAVLGWTMLFFTFSHWWALRTANEGIVGPLGLFTGEVVRSAPDFAYFFVVGLVFGHVMGPRAGAKWALLSAAAAMCVHALLARQIFYGVDFFAVVVVVVLAIDYVLPLVFAIAGAVTARLWRNATNGAAAT